MKEYALIIKILLDMAENFHSFSYGSSLRYVAYGVANHVSVHPYGCTGLVEEIEHFFKYSYMGP